jgi:hypothetical protein
VNANDWLVATGSNYVGLGGGGFHRPINPKLLPRSMTKQRSAKSPALTRQTRRMILQVAQLTAEVDTMLPPATPRHRARAATRSPSIMAQAMPGAAGLAAQARHNAIVQRWRKGF